MNQLDLEKFSKFEITKTLPFYADNCKCYFGKDIAGDFIESISNATNNFYIITDITIQDKYKYLLNYKCIVLKSNIKASLRICNKIIKDLSLSDLQIDFLISFGSGTINDITKYVAYKLNIPYISIASALSMNGYTSSNASLIYKKLKQSFSGRLASIVVFDYIVLKDAPFYLTKSGFLDTLAIITANFDIVISNLFTNTTYNTKYYLDIKLFLNNLINEFYDLYISTKKATKKNNKSQDKFFETLVKCIILGGFAMSLSGSSFVASGSEHILSHLMEMKNNKVFLFVTHGESVGSFLFLIYQMQNNFLKYIKNKLHYNSILNKVQSINLNGYTNKIFQDLYFSKSKIQKVIVSKQIKVSKIPHKDAIRLLSDILLFDKQTQLRLLHIIKHYDVINDEIKNLIKISHLTRDRFTILDLINYIN